MRLKNSIITKVTLLFIFSVICFVCFAIYFIDMEKSRYEQSIKERYGTIIDGIDTLIINGADLKTIDDFLKGANFFEEYNSDILRQGHSKYFLVRGINSTIAATLKEIGGHFYIALYDTLDGKTQLYSDYKDNPNYANYYIIALIAFITLVFFYFIVLDSLLPLFALQKEVRKFSQGAMEIKIISNKDDEIGILSKEFSNAVSTISEMTKARTLFLRSIMHELKTPITKGFLVVDGLDSADEKNKRRLEGIFKRLSEIIDSFAAIEKINTNNYKVNKSEFAITDLMQEVNKMLIIEYERPRKVILENRNAVILGDFELMSLSLKNLVDNAFKYSTDKKVRIFVENNDLVIQNAGAPFKNDINEYFKPFYDDGTNNSARGLGLGMYIIKNTTFAQGYEFLHKYEQNYHYFYIKNCIIS
ncbi:ArsS family sensor histidine kinase [Helicobacter sp. 23-1044]